MRKDSRKNSNYEKTEICNQKVTAENSEANKEEAMLGEIKTNKTD